MSTMKVCVFGFGRPDSKLHIATQLSAGGLRVVVEPDGLEQLDSALRDGVDVVVVNVDSGLDVVRRITHRSDCKVVGVGPGDDASAVIEAMRAGCCQYVQRPVTRIDDIREAIESIRTAEGMRTSKRVCVVGSSGAAGATTLACHMAAEFAAVAGTAAIVDLDLEMGDVATLFDTEPPHCLADLCRGGADDDSVVSRIATAVGQVSILARPKSMQDVQDVTPESLGKAFASLSRLFPYVVVDMSRPNGELGSIAMRGADYVVVVAQANVPSIRNALRVRDAAVAVGVDASRVRFVLNRCGSMGCKVDEGDVAGVFGSDPLARVQSDWSAVRESLDLGKLLPAGSTVGEQMRRAARDLVGMKSAPPPRRRRTLASLFTT